MDSINVLCLTVLAIQFSVTLQQPSSFNNWELGYRLVDINIQEQKLLDNYWIEGITPPQVRNTLYYEKSADAWPYRAIQYNKNITRNTPLDLSMQIWHKQGNYIQLLPKGRLCAMSGNDEYLGMPDLVSELIGLDATCRRTTGQVQALNGLNQWTLQRLLPVSKHFQVSDVAIKLVLTTKNKLGFNDGTFTQRVYEGTLLMKPASEWIKRDMMPYKKCDCSDVCEKA